MSNETIDCGSDLIKQATEKLSEAFQKDISKLEERIKELQVENQKLRNKLARGGSRYEFIGPMTKAEYNVCQKYIRVGSSGLSGVEKAVFRTLRSELGSNFEDWVEAERGYFQALNDVQEARSKLNKCRKAMFEE